MKPLPANYTSLTSTLLLSVHFYSVDHRERNGLAIEWGKLCRGKIVKNPGGLFLPSKGGSFFQSAEDGVIEIGEDADRMALENIS